MPVDLPSVGDERNASRSDFAVTRPSGERAQVSFTTAVVRVGHAFVSMVVTSVNGAEPASLISDALTIMAKRIE